MSEVKNWNALLKANVDTTHYVPVTGKKKFQILQLFPTLTTVGAGSESIYDGITFQNQLNMKGLKSTTPTMLSLATNAGNIDFTVLPGGIDLSLCNNAVSNFLSTVSLATDVTGVLPVVNGGTGISTIADGEFLYATGANTIGKTGATNVDGQLFIGNSATGRASLVTLTAGAGMTITNGPGTITLDASVSAVTSNIDMNTFNINMNAAAGASWISGNGTPEGITVDTNGYVFIGDNLPSVPSPLISQLTLGGNATNALSIGNVSNYKNHTIKVADATGAVKGIDLLLHGANGSGISDGGSITLEAGTAPGAGTGGTVTIASGSGVGASGGIVLGVGKAVGVYQDALVIDSDGNTNIDGRVNYTQTPQTLTGAGAITLITQITYINTTGANALTLADGIQGQTKNIVMIGDLGDGTLNTITSSGFTSITFTDVGDTVSLMYLNGAWHIMSSYHVTIA